jgi:hypothetical protein
MKTSSSAILCEVYDDASWTALSTSFGRFGRMHFRTVDENRAFDPAKDRPFWPLIEHFGRFRHAISAFSRLISRFTLSTRFAMPIFSVARAILIVRITRPILDFCSAKICSTWLRIFGLPPLVIAVRRRVPPRRQRRR